MIGKRIALAATLVASFGLSGTVAAQEHSWSEVDDDSTTVPQLDNMTADELEDSSIYDSAGTKIGEVDNVLKSDDDDSMAVSVEVGEFLGLDDKTVVLPLDDISQGDNGLTTSMSKDDLESQPDYDD